MRIILTTQPSLLAQTCAALAALMLALLLTAGLLWGSGQAVTASLAAMLDGAFGGEESLLETLTRATPLCFTALATVLAYRARIWSIGQEGQLLMGAIVGYLAAIAGRGLPAPLLLIATLAAGALGGAAAGALCGWLKSRFEVDEIISTVMFNYIVFYLLTWLLSGPLRVPGQMYLQSPGLPDGAILQPLVADTRFHAGFALALLAVAMVHVLLARSALGFDARAFGFNPTVSRFKGLDVPRLYLLVMGISGALAGLAGVTELMGVHGRLNTDLSAGLGYTGIIVAMIAGLNPLGALVAAIVFGGLVNGGFMMQVLTGVPKAIVYATQGIVLLSFLCASVLVRYRVVRQTP